jgi:restriction system protein
MSNFGATRGLLVSWGGFRVHEVCEGRVPAPVLPDPPVDSEALIDKITEVYERLPGEIQAELPLRRIWTLVPEEAD